MFADPLFVDAEMGDFRLREGPPTSKIVFVALDVTDAGPRR